MIELSELILSFWRKSKNEWNENKHKFITFAVVLLTFYLMLEVTSYIFAKSADKSRTNELIRLKFIDKRIEHSELITKEFFTLKEKTRFLLEETHSKNYR